MPGRCIRPIGYVEPDPIVRRIGERELYLGNEHAASDPDCGFDAVLSLTDDPRPATTHHRPLVDGPDIAWRPFRRAVDTGRRRFRRGESMLVHCRAGVSRSSTVLATTVAIEEQRPFRDALAAVQRARPSAEPHPDLRTMATIYLAASGER